MIEISYDSNMLAEIEKKLGDMRNEAPKVLKNAINQTAKQARKELATEAQKKYVVKSGRFNKAMKIKKATARNFAAIIKTTGKAMGLKDFKVSPATMQTGNNRPPILKAKVLKAGGMKSLEKGDLKAFITKFSSKHLAVVQRRGKKRFPIKTLSANSIPIMLGNKQRVYGIVEPNIKKNLKVNVEKQVKKVLEA